MTKSLYTEEQLGFLRLGYQLMGIELLTAFFNLAFRKAKMPGQIRACLQNHKIRCGRKGKDRLIKQRRLFSDEQESFIRREYKSHSIAELTELFNSTFGRSVTRSQIKAFTSRRKIVSGRTGHYSKGHKPWNNGTKGKGICKPNSGSFKKGEIPANTKPLGHERVCSKDGYILIKVEDKNPYTGAATRYKHKHVHLYEQKNGPVPDGMVVIFKDGDKRNFEPENLVAITRSELVRLNQNGYGQFPAELKPTVFVMTKLKAKAFERMKELS